MPATPHRHLLIPFAGRGTPACRQALAGLRLPRLEALLARLAPAHDDLQDEDTRSPPHERARAEALGLGGAADGLIPWAALAAREAGLARGTGDDTGWAFATLCHWQVGIDDVVLGDPAALGVDAGESAALLAAARSFLVEDGVAVHEDASPGRWLLHGTLLDGLSTSSPDRAIGQPVAAWQPLADGAAALRRLQHEIQMLLYAQPVNDARVARGALPVNALWLSGTGRLPAAWPPAAASRPPETIDALRAPALHDDGEGWSAAWTALDAGQVAELLAASARGVPVEITLCGDRGARRFGPGGPRGVGRWLRGLRGHPDARAVLETL